eukprot:COSAG01_NODE_4585_length_4896_cov_11.310611_3_plen_64_part_00
MTCDDSVQTLHTHRGYLTVHETTAPYLLHVAAEHWHAQLTHTQICFMAKKGVQLRADLQFKHK